MFPFWLKIIFACSGVIGLLLLIKSISKIIGVYNHPNNVEFSATVPSNTFEITQIGMYEIAVKRPSIMGIIPTRLSFCLTELQTHTELTATQNLNLLSQRKNMSGDRIVPVYQFKAEHIGKYQLDNFDTEKFKEKDKLLISPHTGSKGIILIMMIVFSAILFIGGSVLTLISLIK